MSSNVDRRLRLRLLVASEESKLREETHNDLFALRYLAMTRDEKNLARRRVYYNNEPFSPITNTKLILAPRESARETSAINDGGSSSARLVGKQFREGRRCSTLITIQA